MVNLRLCLVPLVLPCAPLCAQDTRTVTEPVVPPVCAVLKAQLAAPLRLSDETALDTARIQQGIDGCDAGHALELAPDAARNAFLSGPLHLKAGVALLIDKGVTLFASRDPRQYDLTAGSCGINSPVTGCSPLIGGKAVAGAAIMGEGVIDGRGGSKMLAMTPDGPKEQAHTWWDLAEIARTGDHQQVPRLIVLDHCDDFTLYRITLKNAAFFHVTYSNGDGFTVWGLRIDTPRTARNTDGVDPGASKNITVTQSYIRDGDDNIAIKGGSGPVTNMTVAHNHFYWGHGMSIGSETQAGVSALRVTDLSLDGTDAGIRIKSQQAYGGLVHDAVYDDICIRNSRAPIQLDTDYKANPKPGSGRIPVYEGIVLHDVRISGGGKLQLLGFDAAHRLGVQFDGVLLDDPSAYKLVANHTNLTLGPGPVNFQMRGTDSTERGKPEKGTLAPCTDKFVPFPEN